MKTCSRCRKTKPLYEFSKNSRNKTDGRQPKCKLCNKAYYDANSEREKARTKKWYWKNHERVMEYQRERAKDPEFKKTKAASNKKYYEENKEQIQAYFRRWALNNKSKLRANRIRWYWKNLEHARLYSRVKEHKRRAQKARNTNNTLSKEEAEVILKTQPFCSYCHSEENLQLDHIEPLSRGGANSADNIMVLCGVCNSSKGAKSLLQWFVYKATQA